MRLELQYTTTYTYNPLASSGLTAVRIRPRSRTGLVVESSTLHVSPGRLTASYVDGWGTLTDLVEFAAPHRAARYDLRAVIDTDPSERPAGPDPLDLPLFLADSPRVRRAAAAALGWTVDGEGAAWSSLESALAWMPQRFSYVVGATDAHTPVERAIELGVGVCQDFAHIFLALVREWGWPARYASGYVFTEGGGDIIEAEAMHAWVEVFRSGFGWVGMDPTTGQLADERYVLVAHGRDYDDVRPIRGMLTGTDDQGQKALLRIERVPGSPPRAQQQS